ncbi:hypothetical protein FQN50_005195 [Emmonsiellopsis sp. PD_5]|nr:hypothetical protein FQN50_005195 [Emmonsiellopsis sp. PD_5]
MSDPSPNPPPPPAATPAPPSTKGTPFTPTPTEQTFTNYTHEQGTRYAQSRSDYHPTLYNTILTHHTTTGGQLDTLLDIGCGPGTAARALAPHFTHTIGLDPSAGMISNARVLGGVSGGVSGGEPIRFEISSAEELGWHLDPAVEEGSVDLITAATAAHWFDMRRFWERAGRVLRRGGTVALWTSGPTRVHPDVPNGVAIQQALEGREEELKEYFKDGTWVSRGLYVDLPMPWGEGEGEGGVFDEGSLFRKEWGVGEEEEFFGRGPMTVDMDAMEKVLGTMSPIQRWREAHPDVEAGSERDIARLFRRDVERLLHEAGVEKGKEVVRVGIKGVLLMVKKRG